MKTLRDYLLLIGLGLCSPVLPAMTDIELSSLAQQGKHHELISALAPLVKEGQEVSSFRLMMLSGAYYQVGSYQRAGSALALLEQRLATGDTSAFGGDLSIYPEIIRSAVALDQGLYDEAIRRANSALTRLKKDQNFYRYQQVQLSGILGVAQALTGKHKEAERSIAQIRAVDLKLSNLGPEKFTAIARIQMALNDFPGALRSITDPAAAVSPQLTAHYDPTFQDLPRFFIRTKGLFETGQTAAAKRGYDELLQHPQLTQFGTVYWIVLYDRARIAVADGDLDRATELLKKAIEVIEQRRSTIASEAGRIGFVGDKQAVYGQLVSILIRQGLTAQPLAVVERAKSRALVDLLAAKTDFAGPGADSGPVRQALTDINATDLALLEKQAPRAGDSDPQQRNLGLAQQQLSQAAPELATLVRVGNTPVAEIASLLPAGTVLVEYYYFGDECYAFVVKEGQVQAVRLTGRGLEQDVLGLRKAIAAGEGTAWQAVAERLYARLWQPLETLLGAPRRVLVVAHGVLHYLPFAALRASDGTQLVDHYALYFLPSTSVLKFLPSAPVGTQASLLALGNPDLGDPQLDLSFAGEEASAVSKRFAEARLLLRQEASETNFRKLAPAYQRIHIASHGRFEADAPLASGLYLAKDAQNDGVLTVGELYSIRLNADLVTLSACEPGLGKITNGDDVVGLGRGLLYAGAHSIVASLWEVDDQATAELMLAFYAGLAETDKAQALRQAQLATRNHFPHPLYWAAFQLIGKAD
ncbi:CHAT domain-containing protein [uncultured Thiodictyon sp.]|uniref:CHAT domain-containing protein n=1 Tax=uncultured Thiodictyon sp. TaxID=1846217 RepID=UPI0025EFDE49|nr:CHAT domain-containing protein [uncultured Thiodictyon sp.]